MRLSRVTPSSTEELQREILDDLESLEPGLRLVAQEITLGARGTIDLLAADGRGRLAILLIRLEADPAMLGRSIRGWEWLASSLPALRSLIGTDGLDLTIPPRLILAASRIDEDVRSLASRLVQPEVEMIETDLVEEGDRRGILARRIELSPEPAATPKTDVPLDSAPPGQARSLMRRVLEEITHAPDGGLHPGGSRGCVDLRRGGRIVASLIATDDGLEVRRYDRIDSRRVRTDAECREAAGFLTDPRTTAGTGLAGAALTPEEIAEFQSLQSEAVSAPDPEQPRGGGMVEN